MSFETYGRYQLVKKLATGGMAQIFLARQVGLEGFEKLMVVKRILPHLAENDDFITMFLDEARIAARLNHPNIVQIFDLGAQDDSYFIAMEYIHGEDVRRVWKKADASAKPLPVPLICRIIAEACAGLDYAHKRTDAGGKPLNIVHRDISPQNILVSYEGGVKVVDFGIAKAADQATVTRSGVLKGKYSYMSPEQAGGQHLDARSDIFALGVVLYELLTQTRLFKRPNDIQTLNAVTECAVVPASQVSARVPDTLNAIVMKALAKNVDQRYREARELQADLEQWLLTNQLPSSAAHLAAFMQDVYADRLAREAEEGRMLFDTLDGAKSEEIERATPSQNAPRPTKSVKSNSGKQVSKPGTRATPNLEATTAERPRGTSGPQSRKAVEKAIEALPEQPRRTTGLSASVKTQSDRSRALPYVAVAAAGVIAAVIVGTLVFRPPPVPERKALPVRVVSTPPGAQVSMGGKVLCTTPCALPAHQDGSWPIHLKLTGYLEQDAQVTFPAESEVPVAVVLIKVDPVQVPKAPEPLSLNITSVPPADLSVNGEPKGKTPVNVSALPGAEVALKLELAGYEPRAETFKADAAELEHRYELKKLKPDVAVHTTVKPKDPVKPPEVKQMGAALFIVKPWATVVCDGISLGEFPGPARPLPVGEHRCTFSNPDLSPKTQVVKVEPGPAVTKVQVDLTH